MTGRFLLTVLLTLSLAGSILGQTVSITTSISLSTPASIALTPTISTSISLGTTPTISTSISSSLSISGSPSTSSSISLSYSNSISPPVPAAPVNLTNHFPTCALRPDNTNHIYYLCLAWSDPTYTDSYWIVTITPTGGTASSFTIYTPFIEITGLTPNTTYAVSVVGVGSNGAKSAALTGSYTTDPTDAKTAYKTKDLQNLSCQNAISNTTYRRVINCQWGSPPVLPSFIDVKGRCIATGARNKIVHRSLKGSATTVQLPVHRAQYSCFIEIIGSYLNHKANDGHGHRFVVTCQYNPSVNNCTVIH